MHASEHPGYKSRLKAALSSDVDPAGNGEPPDHVGQQDEQRKGKDIVGQRPDDHRYSVKGPGPALAGKVAGQPADDVPDNPRDQRRRQQQARRPRQRRPDQLAHRCRKLEERNAKVRAEQPLPEIAILLEHRSLQPVHLGEVVDHLSHRRRVQVRPHRSELGNRPLHRIRWRETRDKEHGRYPDKDNQDILDKPWNQISFYKRHPARFLIAPRSLSDQTSVGRDTRPRGTTVRFIRELPNSRSAPGTASCT